VTPPPHAGGGDLEVEAGWDEDTGEYVVRAGGVESRDDDAGEALYQEWVNNYRVQLDTDPPTELAARVRTVLTGAPVAPTDPGGAEVLVGWDEERGYYVVQAGGAEAAGGDFGAYLLDEWVTAYRLVNGGDPSNELVLRVQILLGLAPPTEL